MSDKCIYCGEVIDEDRLWFLSLGSRPLTCEKCTMEQSVHKEKVKILKGKTDTEMKRTRKAQAAKAAGRAELKKYNKQFRFNNKNKRRKKKRK